MHETKKLLESLGSAVSTLFVAGPGRSGTSAFTRYLNQHEEILVCQERYKFTPKEVTPELFTLGRILDYRKRETNLPRENYVDLISKKDPAKLKWIGDKTPGYVQHLKPLFKNNPGARFVVLYRPIEEVAESYDARSKNPNDPWLGGKNGFKLGVKDWNSAMRRTREFIQSALAPEVLIVSYHDFFYRSESYIPLLSRFLGLEFGEDVRRVWRKTSLKFEQERRRKESLTGEQARLVEKYKDRAAEEWVLERIKRQWEEPEKVFSPADATKGRPRVEAVPPDRKIQARQRRIEDLEARLLEEQGKVGSLGRENQSLKLKVKELERKLQAGRRPGTRKLVEKTDRIKNGLLKRLR